MKPIWKLVITIYLAAAALSAVSAGARHAYDAAETVRCAAEADRVEGDRVEGDRVEGDRVEGDRKMITVRLPDGEEIDVDTDDPVAAAQGARLYLQSKRSNAAGYSTEELLAEAIRRRAITWREVPPEKVDEVKYLLAKSESGSIDPLWCQARSVRDSKDAFYVPAWVMISVSAAALVMALCLGLLYAVVRVVKLAWR